MTKGPFFIDEEMRESMKQALVAPNPYVGQLFEEAKGHKVGAQLRIKMPKDYVCTEGPPLDIKGDKVLFNAALREIAGEQWQFATQPMVIGVDPGGKDITAAVAVYEKIAYDEKWPVVYAPGDDTTRPATQADISGMQQTINRLVREKQRLMTENAMLRCKISSMRAEAKVDALAGTGPFDEVVRLRAVIESLAGGKPLWFVNPIKGDVVSGHQWTGADWKKLQLVEPSPEIDRIWAAVQGAARP